jgi:hypothetical protein
MREVRCVWEREGSGGSESKRVAATFMARETVDQRGAVCMKGGREKGKNEGKREDSPLWQSASFMAVSFSRPRALPLTRE